MSDLIEKLHADEWASNATLRREAAAEIERLKRGLDVLALENEDCQVANLELTRHIAKLKAVVDAANDYFDARMPENKATFEDDYWTARAALKVIDDE